eukprot:gene33416-40424_t
MAQPFAVFGSNRDAESASRLMRNLLVAAENKEKQNSVHDAQQHGSKRPVSANPVKKVSRASSRGRPNSHAAPTMPRDQLAHLSKEDMLMEIQELKKRLLHHEETINAIKSENQRLEMDNIKQQRRIEQLLHLSEGAKGSAQNVRKEIEKSILVRQLKTQVTALRNLVADKDLEIDSLRRDIRSTHVKELEAQKDEYALEVQRLMKVVDDVKDELFRERQRREWNSKLASETGEELRRELARLAAGYQHILTNMNARVGRPTSSGGISKRPTSSSRERRPQSAVDLRVPVMSEEVKNTDNEDLLESFNVANHPTEMIGMPAGSSAFVENALDQPPSVALDEYHLLIEEQYPEDQSSNRSRPLVSDQVITVSAAPPVQKIVITEVPKFAVGDKIEARYYNGQTWYAGTINGILYHEGKRCFVYDVKYNDGEREKQVGEENIRNIGQPAPSSNATSVPVNEVVEVIEQEITQAPEKVASKFKVGDIVEGYFDLVEEWYQGTITHVNNDSTYAIHYDDGDKEASVEEKRIRLKHKQTAIAEATHKQHEATGQPNPSMLEQAKFKVGDKVEANYRGKGKYFPGKVRKVD